MDLPPSFCLFSLVIKRKKAIFHQFLPSFFDDILIFGFVLCLFNEVVEILIIMVEAEKTYRLKVTYLDEMMQLREK
jgi:hypothetical protein